MGKLRFRTILPALVLAVLLALLPGIAAEARADGGTLAVKNYSCSAETGCSFDITLSGSAGGQVASAVYSEAGQMCSVQIYSAAETVHVNLPGVTPEQTVKVFWLDTNSVPQAEAVGFRAENGPEETPEGVTEEGEYTSPQEVAEYLHRFGHLPSNFITKSQAKDMGWDSRAGNLWDAAPGKSIGGDSFGNREGLLPQGRYRECDVNYSGGYRGTERLVYDEDGSIWYTSDHYESFTQLY